jgi:hypothetical protein
MLLFKDTRLTASPTKLHLNVAFPATGDIPECISWKHCTALPCWWCWRITAGCLAVCRPSGRSLQQHRLPRGNGELCACHRSAVGGILELIEDGGTGFLLRREETQDLTVKPEADCRCNFAPSYQGRRTTLQRDLLQCHSPDAREFGCD